MLLKGYFAVFDAAATTGGERGAGLGYQMPRAVAPGGEPRSRDLDS